MIENEKSDIGQILSKVKAEDAKAFWDEAVEKNDSPITTSGLTYEQARKMGLGPEDLPKTK